MKIIESFKKWVAGKRQKPMSTVIRRSLYVSFAIHGLLLLGAAVFVISHIFYNRESTFVGQPPPMKSYEPRKLEFKVKVSKQQRSSSRPSMSPRMVSTKMTSQLALPEIKMDPKVVKTSFQPKFKAFSGTGLGSGLGTGYGLSGFGTGVSAFDFFGIRGRGDKIAILVDVSVSMIEEREGGIRGYQRVKDRINKVIDALSEAAMFNVIVFADAASAYEKQMVVANDDYKTKAKLFLRVFNTEGNYGLTSGNLSPSATGVSAVGGTTRLDLALTAAFEQGADTILIISDGLPQVKKGVTAAMAQARAAEVQRWTQANQGAMAAYEAAAASYQPPQSVSERVWIPEQPAVPARPPSPAPKVTSLKEGQAPPQGDPGSPGRAAIPAHWEVRTHTVGPAAPARPAPPPMADPGFWTLSDFVQHLKILHESLYVKKGKKLPVIHAIGYCIDKEGDAFLKQLAEIYKGRYRKVARID
ncbi:MAG: vWA domain-containing protein [bacterium]